MTNPEREGGHENGWVELDAELSGEIGIVLTPQNLQIIFIDHQPQIASGLQSIDRQIRDSNDVSFYALNGMRTMRLMQVSDATAALASEVRREREGALGAAAMFEDDVRRALDTDCSPVRPPPSRRSRFGDLGRPVLLMVAAAVVALFALRQFPFFGAPQQQANVGSMELASSRAQGVPTNDPPGGDALLPQLTVLNVGTAELRTGDHAVGRRRPIRVDWAAPQPMGPADVAPMLGAAAAPGENEAIGSGEGAAPVREATATRDAAPAGQRAAAAPQPEVPAQRDVAPTLEAAAAPA